MSNFHWTNIISLNSSQNDAFEELLCQIAKKEPINNKKEFIKVGNPDGGVECYIILNNDDEVGFQAKWFLATPGEIQWNQIEKSFKTTLEKHSKMVTYYIAIPLDRADPRIDEQQWFMDKWDEKIKQWKQFAKDKYNRGIDIIYWGSSEFITRLSKDENTGLKSFFFGDIDLSNNWFQVQNELAIKDLGARYTPKLNVKLNILENFDAISRNKRFKIKLDNIYHELMLLYREFLSHKHQKIDSIEPLLIELHQKNKIIEDLYSQIQFDGIKYINHKAIYDLLEAIEPIVSKVNDLLYELNQNEIKEKKIVTSNGYRASTPYDTNIRDFREYHSSLNEFQELFNSRILKLANNPFVILDGEAGIGKSHLLADIVTERVKENFSSIFLLGQHFREDKEPWTQIFELLHLRCNKEEFLGALNAKAESQGKRLIVFIDAINEGKGRAFWNEFIFSFLESIKKYEWLGLVLSIRSSYLDLMIPKEVFENNLAIQITHFGFQGIEYNASKLFFENYHLVQPSIPLLHPEFSNPLFLKLFCEGLNKKGQTHISDGIEGITNIIKFFIEGIEEKLSKKYPNIKSIKSIDKTIQILIPKIIEKQTIAYDDALETFIQKVSSRFGIKPEFLDDLVIEGLFNKNVFFDYDTNEYVDGLYFAYERFEDHLKVKYLLDNYLEKDEVKKSFQQSPLSIYFEDDEIFFNRGVIDAMSIQLPEICNVELIDVVEQNEIIFESFLNSLLWRKIESISQNVVDRILKNITNEHLQEEIFKILFSTTSNPKHPLNANLLFDYLSKFSMRKRDVFFIPLITSIISYDDTNPVQRLIDWSWSDEDKSYISDDSILLTSIALSWLLTSSNRRIRDYSTKALIALLQNRILVVLALLKKFENIIEPYVYERLFAVAFGVVVRLEKNNDLKELGEYIYNIIFNKDEVYSHILLRDYAKNTIDYISYLGVDLEIDYTKIIPPYNSAFPSLNTLPTNDDIKKYKDDNDGYHQSRIISSMMTEYGGGMYGDFGRYVFGSSLHNFECKKHEQIISNYATKKIFEEYGYNGDFFGEAEQKISKRNLHHDRYNHSIERIGKKYQWIAYYDTLARITDNFKMYDESSLYGEKRYLQYKGSYEPYVRDIDPTILIKSTDTKVEDTKTFLGDVEGEVDFKMDNYDWIKFDGDLPNPKTIIEVSDNNKDNWIVLNTSPEWEEPLKKGFKKYNMIQKELWYQLKSYIIPQKDLNFFIEWANHQNFWGNWMPHSDGNYQVFKREHYWSESYKFFQNPYYGGCEPWTEIWTNSNSNSKKYPNKVALTTEAYFWEEPYDYSKEDSMRILLPSKLLFEGLNMKYSKRENELCDENGKLICFDPSVYHGKNQALLIKKDKLLNYLNDNNLTLVWTLIGEKRVLTPENRSENFHGLMEISGFTYLNDGKLNNGNINIKIQDEKRKEVNKTIIKD